MDTNTKNTLYKVGLILVIIAGVMWCFTIIGLLIGIPMILMGLRQLKDDYSVPFFDSIDEKTSKIIMLVFGFFAFIIGGLLMLPKFLEANDGEKKTSSNTKNNSKSEAKDKKDKDAKSKDTNKTSNSDKEKSNDAANASKPSDKEEK